jgi:hypothetical protein
VVEFLRANCQRIENAFSVDFLAKGGEAIVYRLEHDGTEELVLKSPLF